MTEDVEDQIATIVETVAREASLPAVRMGLAVAARAIRRGRTLTPEEKLANFLKAMADFEAEEAAPALADRQAASAEAVREKVNRVVNAVSELPDRTSPDDWPGAMLVTGGELVDILEAEFLPLSPAPAAQGEVERAVLEEREACAQLLNERANNLRGNAKNLPDWHKASAEKLRKDAGLLDNVAMSLRARTPPAAEQGEG